MKILFLGPYRQSDEWGNTSRNYIRSLLTTEHDIYTRPIYLAPNIYEGDTEWLEKLETTVLDSDPDFIIQHTLPPFFSHNTHIQNNAILCPLEHQFRTGDINPWSIHFENINHILVPNKTDEMSIKNWIGHKSVYSVGKAVNKEALESPISKLDIDPNCFYFYFIGSSREYDNLEPMLRAYFGEFDENEPVNIIVYSEDVKETTSKINEIKSKLQKYPRPELYKTEIMVQNMIEDPNTIISQLHDIGNCYLSPLNGNSNNVRVLEAAVFNNDVIISNKCGGLGFDYNNAHMINATLEPIFSSYHPMPDLYTSYDKWIKPEIASLQKVMRTVYEKRDINRDTKRNTTCAKAKRQFSYKMIGRNIKDALNDICY